MRIDAPIFTGSFSLNGSTLQNLSAVSTTGSNTFVGNQNVQGYISASALTGSIDFTNLTNSPTLVSGSSQVVNILSSLNTVTASFTPRITNLESKSASVDISITNINSVTASNITRLTNLESTSASVDISITNINSVTTSFTPRISNLESKSSSVDISISNINSVTASNIARLSNLETKSSSVDISITNINSYTSSQDTKNTTLGSYTGSNDTKWTSIGNLTGSYATTGSNTFFGTQTYSGSVYIANDLIVQGSSSIQYISASSVSIGTNIVQLNTANPSVRFAGLTMIDSGSIGGSGSFLYDSLQDEFIFVHRGNGTNITSSHFVLGPETYDSLGNETYLTNNRLPKGTGKEHLVDSCIYHDNNTTCIYNGALVINSNCQFIFGTTPADFTFNVGTTCVGTNAAIAQFYNNDYTAGTRGFIRVRNSANINSTTSAYFGQGQDQKTYFYNNDPSRPGDIVITNTGKVGIGISSPNSQLHISSFDCVQTTTLATAYTAAKFRLDTYCGSGQGISMGNITGYQQYIQAQYSNLTTTNPLMLNPFGGIVGIGTDTNNPTGQKLFIQSNNDQAGITMYNSYDCNMWALATGTTGINNKGFAIRDEINNATRLQIDNCGNVGIGTLSPGGRLDVVTCSNSTQNFYLRNTSNLDASSRAYFNVVAGNTSLSLLALAGGGSCGGTYIAGTTGADMYFQQSQGGTVNMIIKSDGKVGIGTSSPAGFLEIKCAQNTYNRIVACFEASYTSGFAFSDLNGGIKYDAGSNVFCIYSTYPNYGGVMVQTGASQRMLITSCGSVNIGTLATGKHNVEIGDIKDGPGGFAYCYFLVAQGTWATFACVTNNDANVITDITYVNNNDSNRSGVFVARWAYNGTCAGLYIVSCLWNDSQNINQFGLRNNGGALQICLGGGANGYRVQARTQGARATG